jgi:neutral ceramidase
MVLNKIIIKIAYSILVFATLVLFILAVAIEPIDTTPLKEQKYYQQTRSLLNELEIPAFSPTNDLQAGWHATNITPAKAAMVGYTPRATFTAVADSIYCRVISVSNGTTRISFISFDLLIVPPEVKDAILKKIKEDQINTFPYFSAVHSHSSIGNWDNTLAGGVIAGNYDHAMVDRLASKAIQAIIHSLADLQPASMAVFQANAPELVYNRLDRNASTDTLVRGFTINRADDSTAYLVTFAAHATNLPMKSTFLSADYPGQVVKELNDHGSFAMFMAGMVGSHSLKNNEGLKHMDAIRATGKQISSKILTANKTTIDTLVTIYHKQIPLPARPAQLKLSRNWQLRNWLFEVGFGPLDLSVTVVKIGSLVMISMPGDFSGELYLNHIASSHPDLNLIITSFNGDFGGYIIEDKHYYSSKKEEANVMNWLGPYGGQYFASVVNQLIGKID